MKVLNRKGLAQKLGYTLGTLRTLKSRAPTRIPPARADPEGREFWIDTEVDAWLLSMKVAQRKVEDGQ